VGWCTPNPLDGFNNSKNEDNITKRSWGALLGLHYFGGRRVCWSSETGLKRLTSNQLFTRTCTNQTTSWLMRSWNIFSSRTSHEQTWTHETHDGPNLGEAIIFPFIVFSMLSHDANTQMLICCGSRLWGPIILCVDLQLSWGLK